MKITIIILTVLLSSLNLNGQTRIIYGRVISEDIEPLPGLVIENSDNVLLGKTDMDGYFKISIPQETDRLVFCYVGMERTEIKLEKDCDTVEVVMMYAGTYDFITLKKVDRLRKRRFDNLPNLHSDAVKNGLFENNNVCYERVFKEYNPPKPVRDSINKENKLKRKQIKDTFIGLALGDTIRIPYSGDWRYDGTDRTTLHSYSNGVNEEDFECIIKGVITEKNKHNGCYNLIFRVIDCNDCHYDNIVLNGKELKNGELIEYNMKYYKILINK
ncbi:MAG: hypothetical protein ACOYXB_16450 [Bacteroidota bacterium]